MSSRCSIKFAFDVRFSQLDRSCFIDLMATRLNYYNCIVTFTIHNVTAHSAYNHFFLKIQELICFGFFVEKKSPSIVESSWTPLGGVPPSDGPVVKIIRLFYIIFKKKEKTCY